MRLPVRLCCCAGDFGPRRRDGLPLVGTGVLCEVSGDTERSGVVAGPSVWLLRIRVGFETTGNAALVTGVLAAACVGPGSC